MNNCEREERRYILALLDIKRAKLDHAEWYLQNGLFLGVDPLAFDVYNQYLAHTKIWEDKTKLLFTTPRCPICDSYHTVPEGF